MHGVIVKVTINDREVAERALKDQVVPQVAQSPGFVTGYWLRKENSGMSVMIVESEEAARALSEQVESPDPDAVTVDEVEVREVVANA
jgi:alpha-D-ribose 1-methylphosphonate 5-triphosphate synthase subunit PhnI